MMNNLTQEWEAEDLINNIQSLQKDKENPDCEHIDGYDFLASDFCQEKTNGIFRRTFVRVQKRG